MYCFFVFSFYVFPFPTLSTACSYAFVTSTGMFKNELITWMYCCPIVFCCHFFQFSTLATACLFAFVTPAGVFLERVIHAFIRFQLFQPRSYMRIISARVFLERAIHAFFPFLFNFSNRYFGSRHVFRTSHTCVLYTFIISARVLNKSYGLTRPGTSLMRCSFTT